MVIKLGNDGNSNPTNTTIKLNAQTPEMQNDFSFDTGNTDNAPSQSFEMDINDMISDDFESDFGGDETEVVEIPSEEPVKGKKAKEKKVKEKKVKPEKAPKEKKTKEPKEKESKEKKGKNKVEMTYPEGFDNYPVTDVIVELKKSGKFTIGIICIVACLLVTFAIIGLKLDPVAKFVMAAAISGCLLYGFIQYSTKCMEENVIEIIGFRYIPIVFQNVITNIRGKFNTNIIYTMQDLKILPKNDRVVSSHYIALPKRGLEMQYEELQNKNKNDFKTFQSGLIVHGKLHWECPYHAIVVTNHNYFGEEIPKAVMGYDKILFEDKEFMKKYSVYSNNRDFGQFVYKCVAESINQINGYTSRNTTITVEKEDSKGKKSKKKKKLTFDPQVNFAIYKNQFFCYVEGKRPFTPDTNVFGLNSDKIAAGINYTMESLQAVDKIYTKFDNRG